MIIFIKKLFLKRFVYEKAGKKYVYSNGESFEVKPIFMKSSLKGAGGVSV